MVLPLGLEPRYPVFQAGALTVSAKEASCQTFDDWLPVHFTSFGLDVGV